MSVICPSPIAHLSLVQAPVLKCTVPSAEIWWRHNSLCGRRLGFRYLEGTAFKPFKPRLAKFGHSSQCRCALSGFSRFRRKLDVRVLLSSPSTGDCLSAKLSKNAEEKYEFDNIQDLIVSAPSVPSSRGLDTSFPPTLLEREAQALGVSLSLSQQERIEAVNGLLDLLEQKGVRPGYAFEFLRHAEELIDDLFAEAKESLVEAKGGLGSNGAFGTELSSVSTFPSKNNSRASFVDSAKETKLNEPCEQFPEASAEEMEVKLGEGVIVLSTLASEVSRCADKRGLGRLIYYFQLIGLKALNIPKLLRFTKGGIRMVMANVEFLRSLGVRYNHLPGILVRCPQMLALDSDSLAHNLDYLVGLGLARTDVGKMVIKFPQILCRPVETELCKSVEDLASLGVQLKDVKKLLARYPILLTDDAMEKLDPLVLYLERLGVRREHIGTVLIRRPLMLDSDVEKDLVPIGNYLKSLNASSDDIDKILMSYPQIFSYNIEQDFRPTVLYLESLGVESSLMGKLFRRHPRLLQNRHKFNFKLEFLLSLGLEKKHLGKVIFNAPQLLSLSVGDNIEPTIKFLSSIGITDSLLLKLTSRS